MKADLHPNLGPKTRHASMEACLAEVRKIWPNCYIEGSTGVQRSFWIPSKSNANWIEWDGNFVAHAWPIRGSTEFWLRVRKNDTLDM